MVSVIYRNYGLTAQAMYTSDDIGVFLPIENFHSLHLEKDPAHGDFDAFESICEAIMVRNKASPLANWEQFWKTASRNYQFMRKLQINFF